jgi:hypothetical protein
MVNVVGFFCEDIREETANKESFLRVVPDNMNVSQLPGVLAKLCVYVRIHLDRNWKPQPINLTLIYPDGLRHSLGGFEPSFIDEQLKSGRDRESPYVGLLFKALIVPFPIQCEGQIIVVAQVEKEEITCCAVNVHLLSGSDATASEPHSSQSPPTA